MLSLDDVLQTLKSNVRLKKRDLKLLKRELELRLAEGAEEERITQLKEDIANCQEDLDQVRDKFEIATEGSPLYYILQTSFSISNVLNRDSRKEIKQ